MEFIQELKESYKQGKISDKIYTIFTHLYESYRTSIEEDGMTMAPHEKTFITLLRRVEEQIVNPYSFAPYHQKITSPFNYHEFALEFTRPLVDLENSQVQHLSNVVQLQEQLARQENAILFANHQTEIDPQLIYFALAKEGFSAIASDMIFIAGDRVLTDPMAAPFSMGCNLICIYSKRHIDQPPEKRAEKQQHNQKTMRRLVELFEEGGKCIYVAPAGGRDRPNAAGIVEVADFDPQSIEMFRLMAQKSKKIVHFYPLALATYEILPPPKKVQSELGEKRKTTRHKVLISLGNEIDMDNIVGLEDDRHQVRQKRADAILLIVKDLYKILKTL